MQSHLDQKSLTASFFSLVIASIHILMNHFTEKVLQTHHNVCVLTTKFKTSYKDGPSRVFPSTSKYS